MAVRAGRATTAVDGIADAHHETMVALSPLSATFLGVSEQDGQVDDFSPAGWQAKADAARGTLANLAEAEPVDDVDRVTVAAMRERLGLEVEMHDAGLDLAQLNVIVSPLQAVRDVFDVMPADTKDQRAAIERRMLALPRALDGWFASLAEAVSLGLRPARRQVEACIAQTVAHTESDGYFARFARQQPQFASSVEVAAAAYANAGRRLVAEVLPACREVDGCGAEQYQLHSRNFLGATIDPEETYIWGIEELSRIRIEMAALAHQIEPGSTIDQATAILDADPRYVIHGDGALKSWMQDRADEAIAQLDGVHFEIPAPIREIRCEIAPTQTGGIYYTGPSDDLSRPGTMWWSIPAGTKTFSTWRELTTVYHEGVPGHHLQVGESVCRRDTLNKWRRLDSWTSGHGEGWALYAERLMDELGYMQDPGFRMGLLDSQSLRAARVVLDIGVHCGFMAPTEVDGGHWTYDKAWRYLTMHCKLSEKVLRFELDRYLGWPGQATSYKVGERLWLQLRREVERQQDNFDTKLFHKRALGLGGLGLDVLRSALA